jgi:hypothetical protein
MDSVRFSEQLVSRSKALTRGLPVSGADRVNVMASQHVNDRGVRGHFSRSAWR